MEERDSSFFKAYYIIMIVFAIIGLVDAFLIYFYEIVVGVLIWSLIASIFSLGVFILSIIAIVKFVRNQFVKITLVIPIYHLSFQILIFVLGVILGILITASGSLTEVQTIYFGLTLVGVVSSLFELIFSIYILNKFK